MVGAKLKRYIATIVCSPGPQETTRDNAEVLAADDGEAVRRLKNGSEGAGSPRMATSLLWPKTDAA